MGFLFIKVHFIIYSQRTSGSCVEKTQLLSREMMRVGMKILLNMNFLLKHLVGERTVILLWNENIKEGHAPINFLLHSKLYGGGLIVEMLEELIQLFLAMIRDAQVSSTKIFHSLGKRQAKARALDSKSSIKRLATIGDRGSPWQPRVFAHRIPLRSRKSRSKTNFC